MAPRKTMKLARSADGLSFPLGFLDESGQGHGPFDPVHGLLDPTGVLVNPAKEETLQIIRQALAGILRVATPLPAAVVCGQSVIETSGVAQAIGTLALQNGVVVKAADTNVGPIMVGGAGVRAANDGTGNGYPLAPGEPISFAVSSLGAIWICGTAGQFVTFAGN